VKSSGIDPSKLPRRYQRQIADQLGTAKPAPDQEETGAKRIRQQTKRKLNKLETDFLEQKLALVDGSGGIIYQQEIKLWLANGLTYTPDFVVSFPTFTKVIEVKGPYAFDGSLDKLKVAAAKYRHWSFWLAWRDKRTKVWEQQRVLP
jgi:hypothetical protein